MCCILVVPNISIRLQNAQNGDVNYKRKDPESGVRLLDFMKTSITLLKFHKCDGITRTG